MNITSEYRKKVTEALRSSGLFVTCGKEHPNIMSTHWGAIGTFWNRPVFVLPVRKGKLSHDLIDSHKSFAVSVPRVDMSREIVRCDHLSGREVNKFEELNLHPKRAKKIPTYVLGECGLIFECKVIYSADCEHGYVDPDLRADYTGKALHTMYFGEIIECYELNKV